jgi:hypothetical protein
MLVIQLSQRSARNQPTVSHSLHLRYITDSELDDTENIPAKKARKVAKKVQVEAEEDEEV